MSTPKLEREANGYYYAKWSVGRRSKRKSMGTANRADAEKRFAQWLLLDGHRGGPAEEAASTLTVADCWQVYYSKHVEKNVSNVATQDQSWKNLQPHFGGLLVPEVSQDAIDSYLHKRTTGRLGRRVKPATVRRELSALVACLNFCAKPKQKLISPSAIQPFDLPEASEPRDRWLKHDEIQRLLNAASALRRGKALSRGERFLWIALETAARKQAVFDLTWDRVDFETKVIHFEVPGRKRTKKRRVSVPISDALLPVLQRAHDERTNDLVMTNKSSIWSTVQVIALKAGLADPQPKRKAGEKPKATGVSPHVLRHTAATHMARKGVPLWVIAKVLGNTLAMVEKVYAKHSPDDLRDAVDLISGGVLEPAE